MKQHDPPPMDPEAPTMTEGKADADPHERTAELPVDIGRQSGVKPASRAAE